MKTRFLLLAVALAGFAATAGAQAANAADTSGVSVTLDTTASAHTPAPSAIDSQAAVHRAAVVPNVGYAMAETHRGLGQAKALMGVGVVGFVAGAVISGDSGKLIMVGSAIVGLYGLYLYLQ